MQPTTPQPLVTRTVLITGASSGIGLDLARLFAADHYRLVLSARSEETLATVAEELERLHASEVVVIPIDLTETGAPDEIARLLAERGISVDVLVNNAGYGAHGPFVESDLHEQLGMLQLNIAALTHLTRLFLPGMVERKWGRIMNVASTAAFQPGPLMACYYATKAYVLSFSEAISSELTGTGVTVTALCPGPTSTAFTVRARVEQTRVFQANMMDSATVALLGYQAMNRGKVVAITGLNNQLLAMSNRFFPRFLVRKVVKRLNSARTLSH